MLEVGGTLQTWAFTKLPLAWRKLSDDPQLVGESNCVLAERLADHRLDYLTYEGPVSGDRGEVCRLEQGTFHIGATPATFFLEGNAVRGEIEFVPVAGANSAQQLIYRPASSTAGSVLPAT
jgi:hypothetical protein